MRKSTKEDWASGLRALLDDPSDSRLENLAAAIDMAIRKREKEAFEEAKKMMQQCLDEMRWDL